VGEAWRKKKPAKNELEPCRRTTGTGEKPKRGRKKIQKKVAPNKNQTGSITMPGKQRGLRKRRGKRGELTDTSEEITKSKTGPLKEQAKALLLRAPRNRREGERDNENFQENANQKEKGGRPPEQNPTKMDQSKRQEKRTYRHGK